MGIQQLDAGEGHATGEGFALLAQAEINRVQVGGRQGGGVAHQAQIPHPDIAGLERVAVQPSLDHAVGVTLGGGPVDGVDVARTRQDGLQLGHGGRPVQGTAAGQGIDGRVPPVIVAEHLLLSGRVQQDGVPGAGRCLQVAGDAPIVVASQGRVGEVASQRPPRGSRDQKDCQGLSREGNVTLEA